MFRKIHSKVPGPGLGAALMEAFGARLYSVGVRFRSFCQRHPKKIYAGMVLLMCASVVLCFSIMRLEDPVYTKNVVAPVKVASDASGNIGMTLDKLQRVMALQSELQSLSKKQSLSAQDSVRFIAMLSEIRELTSNKK